MIAPRRARRGLGSDPERSAVSGRRHWLGECRCTADEDNFGCAIVHSSVLDVAPWVASSCSGMALVDRYGGAGVPLRRRHNPAAEVPALPSPVGRARWCPGLGSQLTLVAVSFQAYAADPLDARRRPDRPRPAGAVVGRSPVGRHARRRHGPAEGPGPDPGRHGDGRRRPGRQRVDVASRRCGRCSSARRPSAGFQGVDWPARRAALPMLVDEHDVTAAIALQTTIQQLALVAGPALAGVLIATIGLSAVYGIDVATFSVALVAALLLPALVPSGGGTPMGLRSMTEGFRHLRRERLLSATYWIDLNAMIFGMPRAVFPALGVGLFGGGAGVVGLLYAAPGAGALVGSLFTGWCGRVRHQGRAIAACVVVWGTTIGLFGVDPRAVDRIDAAGPGRRRGRGLGGVSPGGAAACRPRTSPGPPLGDVLRRGGRWAPPGRRRGGGGRLHRRTAVRGVVGRPGVCGGGGRVAVARSRTLARRRRGPHARRAGREPMPSPKPRRSWARESRCSAWARRLPGVAVSASGRSALVGGARAPPWARGGRARRSGPGRAATAHGGGRRGPGGRRAGRRRARPGCSWPGLPLRFEGAVSAALFMMARREPELVDQVRPGDRRRRRALCREGDVGVRRRHDEVRRVEQVGHGLVQLAAVRLDRRRPGRG